jgi:hypothetical protein
VVMSMKCACVRLAVRAIGGGEDEVCMCQVSCEGNRRW